MSVPKHDSCDHEQLKENYKQFAYTISHDLSAPVRHMEGFSALLSQKYAHELDDKGQHYLSSIQKAAATAKTMLAELTEFSRIHTRGNTFETVNCTQSLQNALRLLEQKIEESGTSIHTDSLPEIAGDEMQITRLFEYLIENALKFRSADRKPEIHVTSGTGKTVIISDNGVGMGTQNTTNLLLPFRRGTNATNLPGNGMSLTMAHGIMQRHQGDINISSSDEGTTITLTFKE